MRLFAIISAFLFSAMSCATPLHNIVIFGDSLSDNGNLYEFMSHQLPQSPPYFEGRFSNGPIWIEHVIASYFPDHPEAHLFDYAFGGAGVSEEEGADEVLFTLRREITHYLSEHNDKASEDSLFVLWIGANNYLGSPPEVEKTLHDVRDGIRHSLQRLVEKGAKHILVVNLPDLGRTPAAIDFDTVDSMTFFAKAHNELLSQSVDDLKQEYPEVQWYFYDLYQTFNEVVEHPQDYGFSNITGTCVTFDEDLIQPSVLRIAAAAKPQANDDVCAGYLFFDLVHPTALAHQILAEKARLMMDQQGIEFSG